MQVPLRDLGLRRLWGGLRSTRGGASSPGDATAAGAAAAAGAATASASTTVVDVGDCCTSPAPGPAGCALPLLQVWPSQDSPRGEADGQSFVFLGDEPGSPGPLGPPLDLEAGARRDSGIDSAQPSPSPGAVPGTSSMSASFSGHSGVSSGVGGSSSGGGGGGSGGARSPSPGSTGGARRPSSALLLHPAHALRLARPPPTASSPSPELPAGGSGDSMEELRAGDAGAGGAGPAGGRSSRGSAASLGAGSSVAGHGASCSSSTTSSMTSVAAAGRTSDPWLQVLPTDRRRSSTMTARYSLLDALDLEYVLLRAAARGSVGPYSLSESLHKLTFTQSLAFPALARGLAGKRRRSGGGSGGDSRGGDGHNGSPSGGAGVAKAVTALVLMLVSVLVFGAVYKFTRT